MKPCGNPRCCTTTNIADMTEHGWGDCDQHGFWQFPCIMCNMLERDEFVVPKGEFGKKIREYFATFDTVGYDFSQLHQCFYMAIRKKYPDKFVRQDRRVMELHDDGNRIVVKKMRDKNEI